MLVKPPLGAYLNRGHWASRGLVGFWLINIGTSTKVLDLSGNNNNGTLTGTAPSWTGGKYGPAIRLPGTDEYISVADSSSLQLFSQFTYFICYKSTETDGLGFGQKDGTNFYLAANQTVWGAGQVRFRHAQIGDGTTIFNSVDFNNGNWHLIACAWDGANTHLYFDGVHFTGEAATGTMDLSGSVLSVGNASGLGYYGDIDVSHAGIYNRALSQSEIASLYLYPFQMIDIDDIGLFVGANPSNIIRIHIYDTDEEIGNVA